MAHPAEKVLYEIAQECISKAPVIILGSGASAAHGIPGMPGLREVILKTPAPIDGPATDSESWSKFLDELEKTDLESALTHVHLSAELTRHVVETTWDFLAPSDCEIFQMIVGGKLALPLTDLYRHFFKSTYTDIHVVTPNYDRLAEYAADLGGYCHYTGYGYGHLRLRSKEPRPRIFHGSAQARTVNVWKVHGSFDWFRDKYGVVMALPVGSTRPAELEPVIVTPGIEKYRLTHDEPFLSIKQGADSALQSARSYLCIGYGFNDSHVQTKLVEQCRTQPVPLVVLTKEISPTARKFLRSEKCKKYLAIEESPKGCRIYSSEYPDGVEVEGAPFWQLGHFLQIVM